MKQKRPHGILLLLLGLVLAAVHIADRLLWTDFSTGFATAGSVWARYLVWLAVLFLPYLPARWAAPQPASLGDSNMPLGVCMVVAGLLFAATGVLTLPTAWYVTQYPYLLWSSQTSSPLRGCGMFSRQSAPGLAGSPALSHFREPR